MSDLQFYQERVQQYDVPAGELSDKELADLIDRQSSLTHTCSLNMREAVVRLTADGAEEPTKLITKVVRVFQDIATDEDGKVIDIPMSATVEGFIDPVNPRPIDFGDPTVRLAIRGAASIGGLTLEEAGFILGLCPDVLEPVTEEQVRLAREAYNDYVAEEEEKQKEQLKRDRWNSAFFDLYNEHLSPLLSEDLTVNATRAQWNDAMDQLVADHKAKGFTTNN